MARRAPNSADMRAALAALYYSVARPGDNRGRRIVRRFRVYNKASGFHPDAYLVSIGVLG